MRAFGASVVEDEARFTVLPTGYRATHLEIEADASAAVYPLVAAAITSGTVQVTGIPEGSGQADLKALQVLAEMGCKVNRRSDRIELIGPPPPLDPVDIDLSTAPDAAVALAVAAIFAGGASRLRNLGNLRYKESDRLAALQNELRRLGAGADIVGDDLIIHPGPLHAATIQTYDDHRMAMAFALAGLRIEGVIISDPGCVQKTWPQYFEALAEL
jgi:3-phosphoshikimate 1-carboxyvinyltransferase